MEEPLRVFVTSYPGRCGGKEPAHPCRRCKRHRFDPWVGKIPRVGNGNPLQYSCLDNPMDRGAWRMTVDGVARSQTRLSTHTHTEQVACGWKEEKSVQKEDRRFRGSERGSVPFYRLPEPGGRLAMPEAHLTSAPGRAPPGQQFITTKDGWKRSGNRLGDRSS